MKFLKIIYSVCVKGLRYLPRCKSGGGLSITLEFPVELCYTIRSSIDTPLYVLLSNLTQGDSYDYNY